MKRAGEDIGSLALEFAQAIRKKLPRSEWESWTDQLGGLERQAATGDALDALDSMHLMLGMSVPETYWPPLDPLLGRVAIALKAAGLLPRGPGEIVDLTEEDRLRLRDRRLQRDLEALIARVRSEEGSA